MDDRNLVPFLFEGENLVRVVMVNGEPWFVLADVCQILDIKNPRDVAAKSLEPDEVQIVNLRGEGNTVENGDGTRGNPNVNIISESGLYALIFRSRKPNAVKFRKWVTAEVLPSIRKTGSYSDLPGAQADPVRAVPDRTMKQWLDLIREARLLRGKAAAEILWAQSPLPPLPEVSAATQAAEKERFHPKTPLTREQEADIRARYAAGGVSMADLAKEYGVWTSMIQRAVHRRQFDA